MSAKLIDGKACAQQRLLNLRIQIADLTQKGCRPGLAVVLVGDDAASQIYVRHKIKACADNGIFSVLRQFSKECTQQQLLACLDELNQDVQIHGILLQLPLPEHIDRFKVLQAIAPNKDVDGFHALNMGALMLGHPCFKPCTPYGCIELLNSIHFIYEGAKAVVVGASNIVGKPMASMLLNAGATVTICHRKTHDLYSITRTADLLVSATGCAGLIGADAVKSGAVVLDVGMNVDEQGRRCGDVDFAQVRQVASFITPVPGGVGPMTIAMLLENTYQAALKSSSR